MLFRSYHYMDIGRLHVTSTNQLSVISNVTPQQINIGKAAPPSKSQDTKRSEYRATGGRNQQTASAAFSMDTNISNAQTPEPSTPISKPIVKVSTEGTPVTLDCADVCYFTKPNDENGCFGFDDVTNFSKLPYWRPVPKYGFLHKGMLKDKQKNNGACWVSVPENEVTHVNINFDFAGPTCIPCIAKTTFHVENPDVVEVITSKVTTQTATLELKGLSKGESYIKAMCEGELIGWLYVWCNNWRTCKLEVIRIKSPMVNDATYSHKELDAVLNNVYRQALVKVKLVDSGTVDISNNSVGQMAEKLGHQEGKFLQPGKAENGYDYNNRFMSSLEKLHTSAKQIRTEKAAGKKNIKKSSDVVTMYLYLPKSGHFAPGVAPIGSGFGVIMMPFKYKGAIMNTAAHELGHALGLVHPNHRGPNEKQYSPHNLLNMKNPKGNVMVNDETNLMGYHPRKQERIHLRYHQWQVLSGD